jgi:hypothetical protein
MAMTTQLALPHAPRKLTLPLPLLEAGVKKFNI